MASKAAARHHMIRHLPMTRRTVTVAVSAVVAVAVMAGYFVADIYACQMGADLVVGSLIKNPAAASLPPAATLRAAKTLWSCALTA